VVSTQSTTRYRGGIFFFFFFFLLKTGCKILVSGGKIFLGSQFSKTNTGASAYPETQICQILQTGLNSQNTLQRQK
jgi:hypothetical protein